MGELSSGEKDSLIRKLGGNCDLLPKMVLEVI